MDKEKELIDYLKTKEKIVLYGAGLIGGLVKSRIDSNHLGERILCFAKTTVDESETYMGINVQGLDFLDEEDREMCICVCALSATREEMVRELDKRGFDSYVTVSEKMISDMEERYLEEQRELRQCMKFEQFDIVCFSQDNNATSGAFISMAGLCDEIQRKSGLRILVVLPRYGDGESLLQEYQIEYTYVFRKTAWIQARADKNDPHKNDLTEQNDESEEYSFYDREEIDFLRGLFTNVAPKLVHMSGVFVFAGAIAAEREKIPVIWHIRENIATQGNCFINEKASYKLLNASDAVICVSKHAQKAYPGLDDRVVRIIYNGADDQKFYQKRAIFQKQICRIVMVGHITHLKGQDVLIRALIHMKEVNAELPIVTLVGGGESGYLNALRQKVSKSGLKPFVLFAGRTTHPERYYQDADIAVSATSGGEGFDRVRIEAMLSGCLLLANDNGAAREIVQDGKTGYLYQTGDAASLAQVIIKSMQAKKESREIAAQGQNLCMERFTKRHNAEQVLKLYKEILEKNHGRITV